MFFAPVVAFDRVLDLPRRNWKFALRIGRVIPEPILQVYLGGSVLVLRFDRLLPDGASEATILENNSLGRR